jgi:hypothetical protein
MRKTVIHAVLITMAGFPQQPTPISSSPAPFSGKPNVLSRRGNSKFLRLENGRLLGGDGALRRPRTSQRDVRHLALTNFKPLK